MLRAVAAVACVCLLSAAATPPAFKFMSLAYNPSGVATTAQRQKGFSETTLRTDLQHLVPYTRGIRTYSTEFGLVRIPPIARELGLKVSLGLWLGKDRDKNDAEIARGIHVVLGNTDVIDRVYVGNEAIVRGELTAEEVIPYIGRMKDALAGRKIPVGTAEPWHVWLKNPALGAASNFIGAHIYAYHDGPPVAEAVAYLDRRVQELQAAFPAKPIVIAETGWPWAGRVNQAAQPSAAAQAEYLRDFLRRAAQAHYIYTVVEAYDQPWKAPEEQGALWGLLADDGKPKFPFQVP